MGGGKEVHRYRDTKRFINLRYKGMDYRGTEVLRYRGIYIQRYRGPSRIKGIGPSLGIMCTVHPALVGLETSVSEHAHGWTIHWNGSSGRHRVWTIHSNRFSGRHTCMVTEPAAGASLRIVQMVWTIKMEPPGHRSRILHTFNTLHPYC